MATDEGGIEWLYELLQDVQLEQFATRIRDDLQVISCDESSFCKSERWLFKGSMKAVFLLWNCINVLYVYSFPESVVYTSIIDTNS
jgi:hypothetical protein